MYEAPLEGRSKQKAERGGSGSLMSQFYAEIVIRAYIDD